MTTPDEDLIIRPFSDFLREQAKGATHEELGEALHDLIGRVQDTGKKGSLTLTISVSMLKGGDGRALVVEDAIKLKLPEHDRQSSLFYADKNGNLTRNDPDQLVFDSLREVPPPPGVDARTGEVSPEYKDTAHA